MINEDEQHEFEEQTLAYQKCLQTNPDRVYCFNCSITGKREEFAFVQIYNVFNTCTGVVDPENDYYFCEKCFYWIKDSVMHGGVLFSSHRRRGDWVGHHQHYHD